MFNLFPKKPKAIYSAADQASLALLQHFLEEHGILTRIVDSYLSGAAGDLPIFDTWPKLVLVDEDQRQYAERLVKDFHKPLPADMKQWRCAHCGETVDAELAFCWNCGKAESDQD